MELSVCLSQNTYLSDTVLSGNVSLRIYDPTGRTLPNYQEKDLLLNDENNINNNRNQNNDNNNASNNIDANDASDDATVIVSAIHQLEIVVIGKCIIDRSKLDLTSWQQFESHYTSSSGDGFVLFKTPITTLQSFKKVPFDKSILIEPLSFPFMASLPPHLPPSFRGVAIKFVYYVDVAAIYRHEIVAEIKLPFTIIANSEGRIALNRLLNLKSITEKNFKEDCMKEEENIFNTVGIVPRGLIAPLEIISAIALPDEPFTPSSPSSPISPSIDDDDEDYYESSDNDNNYGNTNHSLINKSMMYNIYQRVGNAGNERSVQVLCVRLASPRFYVGSHVTGVLDFSQAKLRSYRVMISLISEERVGAKFAHRKRGARQPFNHVKVHETFSAYTLDTSILPFTLPIHTTSTGNFANEICSYRWSLHCKFITAHVSDGSSKANPPGKWRWGVPFLGSNASSDSAAISSNSTSTSLATSLIPPQSTESLVWILPIDVIPANSITSTPQVKSIQFAL